MDLIRKLVEAVIWLGFFATVFFAYYYYLKFRNSEKMLLIEKGTDISEVYKKRETHFPWFTLGYTILGCALGFALGLIGLLYFRSVGLNPGNDILPMLAFSFMFLFGAIGLIVGSSIEKKKRQ
jgi:amino acid transporter